MAVSCGDLLGQHRSSNCLHRYADVHFVWNSAGDFGIVQHKVSSCLYIDDRDSVIDGGVQARRRKEQGRVRPPRVLSVSPESPLGQMFRLDIRSG